MNIYILILYVNVNIMKTQIAIENKVAKKSAAKKKTRMINENKDYY